MDLHHDNTTTHAYFIHSYSITAINKKTCVRAPLLPKLITYSKKQLIANPENDVIVVLFGAAQSAFSVAVATIMAQALPLPFPSDLIFLMSEFSRKF